MSTLPHRVTLVDVGPRDGLQNEKQPVATEHKARLVAMLQDAGLKNIEVTSFVSPKWVPQMGDNTAVMAAIERRPGVRYSVLTPNMKGLEAALPTKPDEIVVFGAASEAFSQKNINCSIAESIERFAPVVAAARAVGVKVRGARRVVEHARAMGMVVRLQVGRHTLHTFGKTVQFGTTHAFYSALFVKSALAAREFGLRPKAALMKAPASSSLSMSMPVSMPMPCSR